MTSLQTSDPLEAALETIRQRRAAEIQANKDAYAACHNVRIAAIWAALKSTLEPWLLTLLHVEINEFLYDIVVANTMYTAEFRHQEDGWRVWDGDEQDYTTIPHADLQSWLLNDFVDQEEAGIE